MSFSAGLTMKPCRAAIGLNREMTVIRFGAAGSWNTLPDEWPCRTRKVALAEGGRILGVDQSRVGRHLAALETAFGFGLVIRGGRDFACTDAGRVALDTARALQAMTAHTRSAIRAAPTEVEGLVRISGVKPAGAAPGRKEPLAFHDALRSG
jgi:hypothetical protein